MAKEKNVKQNEPPDPEMLKDLEVLKNLQMLKMMKAMGFAGAAPVKEEKKREKK